MPEETLAGLAAKFRVHQHGELQLEESIVAFDARIGSMLRPFHDIVERLKEVAGLGTTSVETIIAEIGTDMSQFPRAGYLLSWAGPHTPPGRERWQAPLDTDQ